MASRRINFIGGNPAYWCPVCDHPHHLDKRWKWNGDRDRPTFSSASPGSKFSYLSYAPEHTRTFYYLKRAGVKLSLRADGAPAEFGSAKDAQGYADEHHEVIGAGWVPVSRARTVPSMVYCHVYVRDGNIQILNDSKKLGGQTLPLQEWDASTYGGASSDAP